MSTYIFIVSYALLLTIETHYLMYQRVAEDICRSSKLPENLVIILVPSNFSIKMKAVKYLKWVPIVYLAISDQWLVAIIIVLVGFLAKAIALTRYYLYASKINKSLANKQMPHEETKEALAIAVKKYTYQVNRRKEGLI